MRALDRKLLRDLWLMRTQVMAIVLVLASAVTILVGSLGTHRALVLSRDAFYSDNQFADIFVRLSHAPHRVAQQIATLPGVEEVQTRVVGLVSLELPDDDQTKSALLVSLAGGCPKDTQGHQRCQGLNRIQLLSGRQPQGGHEVLASQAFVEANQIRLGSSVSLTIKGKQQRFRIVGVALSPEYIYIVRPGELMPDDLRFGILWMQERTLASALDMSGAFNDVAVRLRKGSNQKQLLGQLDRLLADFGGQGAYLRNDHVSHRFLADDIEQLRLIAVVLPTIFFCVAAYLLNMVLSRLVSTQREIIAALKALGYTSWEVALHYFKLVTLVVLAAVGLGSMGGLALASVLSRFYAQDLYRLPDLILDPQYLLILLALVLSLLVAYVGVARSVYAAALLPPAEAMRAKPPASYRPTLLERMGIGRLLSQPGRMVLRSLGRYPLRSLFSSLGLALAVSILVAAGFFSDAIGHILSLEFEHAQRQDMTVTFVTPMGSRALQQLRQMPQVQSCEPFRVVAVELSHGQHRRRVVLTGLSPDRSLRRVLDDRARPQQLPRHGLLITDKLAQLLRVVPGDTLMVTVAQGQRRRFELPVEAVVSEVLGTNAYLSRAHLNRLLKQPGLSSGAYLEVSGTQERLNQLTRKLRTLPAVAGVSLRSDMVQAFERFTGTVILVFAGVLVLFATILVLGVAYNAARILLAEREHELATLRVLGMTRAEISSILLGELGVQVALAIPMGLLLGYGLAAGVCQAMASDLLRLPLVVSGRTYAFAALVCFAASLVAALLVRRRLDRLDLLAVLKTKE